MNENAKTQVAGSLRRLADIIEQASDEQLRQITADIEVENATREVVDDGYYRRFALGDTFSIKIALRDLPLTERRRIYSCSNGNESNT